MKHVSYLVLLLAYFFIVCSSSRSVMCIVPQGQFNPQSESEFLVELNSQLPFKIPPENFITKKKSGGLVSWVVVQNDEQKDILKTQLKKSYTLKLLQVEVLTPKFEAVMKQHKK